MKKILRWVAILPVILLLFLLRCQLVMGQVKDDGFRVIGFFTAQNDRAHISFVHEANKWFAQAAAENNFKYDSTNNWGRLNDSIASVYQVIVFLDTRPEALEQRQAFEKFMRSGGRWLGFHFSAFALTPSAYPENWNWYHNEFLGCGQYKSNTWRPTSANLKVEMKKHPVTKGLPKVFKSSPSEWYRWEKDLTKNRDIEILLSIDESSFPLGTGPKPNEIWHSGYYPVVWSNTKYKMVYMNMGHNDIDYENKTNKELSHTFGNPIQDKLILNAINWLGKID